MLNVTVSVANIDDMLLLFAQAALKALTGANYAYDSNRILSENDLKNLAQNFASQPVRTATDSLRVLLHGPSRMQYPTDHATNTIPHDVYTAVMAQSAEQLSTTIIEWCRSYIQDLLPVIQ